jgi:hypothetical protein
MGWTRFIHRRQRGSGGTVVQAEGIAKGGGSATSSSRPNDAHFRIQCRLVRADRAETIGWWKGRQMDSRVDLAQSLAAVYGGHPQVEAVALGGSLAGQSADERSDLDLYVYLTEALPLETRAAIARTRADRVEVGNDFWEPGDEWIERRAGLHVDVIYRSTGWAEDQLDRVLRRHLASVGYSTCIWHNLRDASILIDRSGWLHGIQRAAAVPYPEELVEAIVAKNYPILRASASAYSSQLRSALERKDWVSVNHRVAAVLASYFDILFAVNRALHPGEKRLLEQVGRLCPQRPARMAEQVHALLAAASTGEGVLAALDDLIDNLDLLLGGMQHLQHGQRDWGARAR